MRSLRKGLLYVVLPYFTRGYFLNSNSWPLGHKGITLPLRQSSPFLLVHMLASDTVDPNEPFSFWPLFLLELPPRVVSLTIVGSVAWQMHLKSFLILIAWHCSSLHCISNTGVARQSLLGRLNRLHFNRTGSFWLSHTILGPRCSSINIISVDSVFDRQVRNSTEPRKKK